MSNVSRWLPAIMKRTLTLCTRTGYENRLFRMRWPINGERSRLMLPIRKKENAWHICSILAYTPYVRLRTLSVTVQRTLTRNRFSVWQVISFAFFNYQFQVTLQIYVVLSEQIIWILNSKCSMIMMSHNINWFLNWLVSWQFWMIQ